MIADLSPAVQELLGGACKQPMLREEDWSLRPILDRAALESILPHRDPFLLIDRVTLLDRANRRIVARYDLTRAADIFAAHFPGSPLWPGVLQVEAVAQAGAVLAHACSHSGEPNETASLTLTHILGARFVRPVTPGDDVVIVARLIEDGLFTVILGQCLQDGLACSAVAVRGLGQRGGL